MGKLRLNLNFILAEFISFAVIILLNAINSCDGISREFFHFTLSIQNHSDVVYITESIPETIPKKLPIRYQISHVENLQLLSRNMSSLRLSKSARHSTKFVISYPSVEETIQTIIQIGSSPELQTLPIHPWILVLWPSQISTDSEAEKIIKENLVKPTENFTIKHELFIGFKLNNNNGSDNTSSQDQPSKKYIFFELYTINNQSIFRLVEDLGTTIVQCEECDSLTQRRFNLQGVLLRLIGVQDSEYNDDTLFDEGPNGKPVLMKSLAKNLTDIMKEMLNFTTTIAVTTEWGIRLPNGSWIGMVNEVLNNAADIGISALTNIPKRAQVISFLPPTDEIIMSAFFNPPSLNAIRDIFMQPFQTSLWAAVVATWLILAGAMVGFTLIRKKFGAHNYKSDANSNIDEEPDFTHDSLIWALATVCQQGWDEHPRALSLRAIFISASFTGVIAYAGYSAAIVSTLSLRVDPIQNLDQLLKSSLRLGARQGLVNDELLAQPEAGSRPRDLIDNVKSKLSKVEGEAIANLTHGTTLLMKKSYAFIATRESVYDVLKPHDVVRNGVKISEALDGDKNICLMKELQILQKPFKGGMFTRKLYLYKEYFKLVLIMIRERGILWRLRSDFTYTRRCLETTDNSGRALGANDVFTAFMVLSGGYFLSIVFLLLEKMIRFNTMIYIR